MKQTVKRSVILSTEVEDLGIVPPNRARRLARAEAELHGVTIYIRDATTDEVVEVIEPKRGR